VKARDLLIEYRVITMNATDRERMSRGIRGLLDKADLSPSDASFIRLRTRQVIADLK